MLKTIVSSLTTETLHSLLTNLCCPERSEGSQETRNKLIAEAFYLTDDTEKYGSGYARIREEIASYPTMKLEYEEMGNGYLATISYERQKVSSDDNEGVNEGVKSLYELIKNRPNNRSTFFAQELHTSVKNIERWLKQLKDEAKIEFKGSPKNGGYLVKDGNQK